MHLQGFCAKLFGANTLNLKYIISFKILQRPYFNKLAIHSVAGFLCGLKQRSEIKKFFVS